MSVGEARQHRGLTSAEAQQLEANVLTPVTVIELAKLVRRASGGSAGTKEARG